RRGREELQTAIHIFYRHPRALRQAQERGSSKHRVVSLDSRLRGNDDRKARDALENRTPLWIASLWVSRQFPLSCGCARKAMAMRFQPLIAITAMVRLTSSVSVKCFFASSNTASGICVSLTRVTASVQARAARSRSV